MITAVHTLVYAHDAEATRAFFRDTLGFAHIDAGGGWLIFKTGPSELGVHPTEGNSDPRHSITLMCDDIEVTVADLKGKGVEFTTGIEDQGFGLTAHLRVPGAGEMMIYEPRHEKAYELAEPRLT